MVSAFRLFGWMLSPSSSSASSCSPQEEAPAHVKQQDVVQARQSCLVTIAEDDNKLPPTPSSTPEPIFSRRRASCIAADATDATEAGKGSEDAVPTTTDLAPSTDCETYESSPYCRKSALKSSSSHSVQDMEMNPSGKRVRFARQLVSAESVLNGQTEEEDLDEECLNAQAASKHHHHYRPHHHQYYHQEAQGLSKPSDNQPPLPNHLGEDDEDDADDKEARRKITRITLGTSTRQASMIECGERNRRGQGRVSVADGHRNSAEFAASLQHLQPPHQRTAFAESHCTGARRPDDDEKFQGATAPADHCTRPTAECGQICRALPGRLGRPDDMDPEGRKMRRSSSSGDQEQKGSLTHSQQQQQHGEPDGGSGAEDVLARPGSSDDRGDDAQAPLSQLKAALFESRIMLILMTMIKPMAGAGASADAETNATGSAVVVVPDGAMASSDLAGGNEIWQRKISKDGERPSHDFTPSRGLESLNSDSPSSPPVSLSSSTHSLSAYNTPACKHNTKKKALTLSGKVSIPETGSSSPLPQDARGRLHKHESEGRQHVSRNQHPPLAIWQRDASSVQQHKESSNREPPRRPLFLVGSFTERDTQAAEDSLPSGIPTPTTSFQVADADKPRGTFAMSEGTPATSSSASRPVGTLEDLPAFNPSQWLAAPSASPSANSPFLPATTSSSSPEDHFLTPRAGSPFFPTSMSALPSAAVSLAHHASQGSFHSPPSTPAFPSCAPSVSTPLSDPHDDSFLSASSDSIAHLPEHLQNDSSSTVTDIPPSRMFTGSPSYSTASESSPASSSATPIAASRQSSIQSSDDAASTVTETPVSPTGPDILPASPVASSWSEQLRASLIAEGLSETAVTAEQEIRSLARGDIGTAVSSASDSAPLPQPQDMTSRTESSSSDISRTPSTSTACSFATSQASGETAPSSVPSETEGAEDKPEVVPQAAAESADTIPAVPDEKQAQSKIRRYHALLELVETERSYASDLSALVHVYLEMLPLQPFFEDHPARVETVVRNAPELLDIHTDVANFLEQILEREKIAATDEGTYMEKAMSKGVDTAVAEIGTFFCELDERLTAYRDFCARHAETLAVVREAERRHNGEDFAAFERLCSNILRTQPGSSRNSSTTEVNRLSRPSSQSALAATAATQASRVTPLSPMTTLTSESNEYGGLSSSSTPTMSGASRQGGRLKFADLLIKPVQRLCLYPLVLHTLLKHTSPTDGGKDELEAAMAIMKRVADDVDEAGKRREQFLFAELVASRLEPKPPVTKALLSQFGSLELSGTLDVLHHHVTAAPLATPLRFRFLGIFLYSNWLLIAKVGKSGAYLPRHWFPLHKAELSSIEEHEGVLPHAFRVTVNGEHHFELAASSSRERALWVDRLAKTISAAIEGGGASAPSTDAANLLPSSLSDSMADLNLATSGRSAEVISRARSPSEGGVDPLSDFLTQQSNAATSAEVLVRYASLAQRAAVDRGMVFSDSVLGARAITQQDGTFTPGGSLTRNSPGSTLAPTPSGSTSTVNLTSWHAATTAPTSSLGAAVGAAMGLARAAKRSSNKSVTNVFEAAAQQYLANEELRLAEEGKNLTLQRGAGLDTAGASGDGSVAPSPRPGLSSRRKRASFAIGTSSRPLNSLFGAPVQATTTTGSPYMGGSEALESPISASSPTSAAASRRGSDAAPRETSSGQAAIPKTKLKRRQSASSGTVLRDALASAGAWSRRGRSQSSDIDTGHLTMSQILPSDLSRGEEVASPTSACFSIDTSDTGGISTGPCSPEVGPEPFPTQGKLTTASAPASRPASIRHSRSAAAASGRERSQSIASPNETPSSTAFPFDTSLRRDSTSQERPAGDPRAAPPPRRRTASSFGSISLVGPSMGTLKRNLSFNRRSWMSSGGRSEASSRRSSVVDAAAGSDIMEDEEFQGPHTDTASAASSSQASLSSRFTSKTRFGRSATDTELISASSGKTSSTSTQSSKPRSLTGALMNTRLSQPSVTAAKQPSSATTAIANVKATGSVSSLSSGSGFLTRTFSRRSAGGSNAERDSSTQTSGSTSRGSRPSLSLRRFTSQASSSASYGMPTPLAEENERTSFDFEPEKQSDGATKKPTSARVSPTSRN